MPILLKAEPPHASVGTRPAARRQRGEATGWLGLGFAVAVLVAASVYVLGPVPPPASVTAGAAEESPVDQARSAPPEAPPPIVAISEVRLRLGPSVVPDQRAALVAALEGAGYLDVEVEPLPFPVASSRVGYYRQADRPAAEALSATMAPAVAKSGAGSVGVSDYSALFPDSVPGTLGLWVEG